MEKDMLRKINRMPTSEFLIKREGAANGDFDDPDADELFEDEWVVIKFERT